MRAADQFMLALTAFRENSEGGQDGMQSVINAIMNRTEKHNLSPYDVCIEPEQFTSITGKGDPNLSRWGKESDPTWQLALNMADEALEDMLPDLTGGATVYYAPHAIPNVRTVNLAGVGVVPFPKTWNFEALRYTVSIKNQLFFVEV